MEDNLTAKPAMYFANNQTGKKCVETDVFKGCKEGACVVACSKQYN